MLVATVRTNVGHDIFSVFLDLWWHIHRKRHQTCRSVEFVKAVDSHPTTPARQLYRLDPYFL